MPDSYPNLREYLKGAVLADRLYKLRRPEEWVTWLAFPVEIMLIVRNEWWWALATLLGSFVIAWLAAGFRVKSFRYSALIADGMKSALPKRMREDLSRGRLEERIGTEAIALLDECARSALVPIRTSVESRMLGLGDSGRVYQDFQRQAMHSGDAAMRKAIATLQGALIWKSPPSESDITDLRAIQRQLAELARESQGAAQLVKEGVDTDAIRESLANLKALRAAQDEINELKTRT